ncbi:MAG: Alpha-acetolactate decarboxylase [Euryarchaeota archaeon ADurb.Bin190]|nr:MAG: Alpha-acetolactate decarboxylase [Euryarchaeota archaeon ADurb.Bin190]
MTAKKNKTISELLSVIFLALLLSGQCAAFEDDVLFQVSTIDALMQGVFDGFYSFDDLMDQGDFGIGTFNALDGEMVALDGEYYQVRADGVAYPVQGDMTAPFAAVTRFEADQTAALENAGNFTELARQIDRHLPSPNAFYALRIDGTFPYVQTRSVPAQEKPYPRLAEAVEDQSVFNLTNVTGSVVGIWSPDFVKGVNVPGYHLHFITEDRKAGGHILEIQVSNATAQVDVTAGFAMQLPSSGDFYNVNLSGDLQEELERIEK